MLWLALGIGFTAALGNADRHRIQQRDDARRYAVGVLGVGSLLLTQLRYEHGNRFVDEPELAGGGDEQPGLWTTSSLVAAPGHVGLKGTWVSG